MKRTHVTRKHAPVTPTKKRKGFTAIELLIVLGLMTATASMTIPMFRQYQIRSDLNTATEHLVQALRSAQSLSLAGKSDTAWGVYFPDATLFAGDSYAERGEDNDVTFPLADTIETSGLTETVFTRIDGLPTITGTVYVTSSLTDEYRRIDIGATGTITVSDVLVFGPGEHQEGDGDDGGSSTSSVSGGAGSASSEGGTTSSVASSASAASTSSTTPSTIDRMRSTSPPKSA